jgi:CheY-like chemotaxis protein
MSDKRLSVLVVDDDDLAAENILRSLQRRGIEVRLLVAEDGREALGILRDRVRDRLVGDPLLVLLDLHMPRMDGFEFLRQLRGDPEIAKTVVFVLTDSDDELDRSRAYGGAVAGSLVKTAMGHDFSAVATLISDYQSVVQVS